MVWAGEDAELNETLSGDPAAGWECAGLLSPFVGSNGLGAAAGVDPDDEIDAIFTDSEDSEATVTLLRLLEHDSEIL